MVITCLLLVSDTVHTVYSFTVSIAHETIRTEEATPTPHICICVTPSVRHVVNLVHEVETETSFQPVCQLHVEVSIYVVTLQVIRVEVHLAFLVCITECQIVVSLTGRTGNAHVVSLRRCSLEHDVLNIPVSIIHGTATIRVHVVVTHIAPALERTHFAITSLLAAILLFPCFCIWQHGVEVHTEQFVGKTGTLVGLAQCLNLAWYTTIVWQISRIAPREVVRVLDRYSVFALGCLGLQHDNTTGCTRTVDRC